DTAAGFRYSYDFDNNGTFEVANSTAASAAYTFAPPGTYTVRGRIADKDGAYSEYLTIVTVNSASVGPTADAGSDRSGAEGSPITLSGSATGTGLTYQWAFGDGATATGTLTPTHTY